MRSLLDQVLDGDEAAHQQHDEYGGDQAQPLLDEVPDRLAVPVEQRQPQDKNRIDRATMLATMNAIRFICATPAVMVSTLYGNGVIPLMTRIHTPVVVEPLGELARSCRPCRRTSASARRSPRTGSSRWHSRRCRRSPSRPSRWWRTTTPSSRCASTIGTSITSGGIGNTELSMNATQNSADGAPLCRANRIIQS